MPVIEKTSYPGPPWYQYNAHLQTIIPTTFRVVRGVRFERERMELEDGDFLDIDWMDAGSRDLLILSHGLEGNSQRVYIKGMAKFFYEQHWDILAWNCRSCSDEMNRNLRLYYHGEIEDIELVIQHALKRKNYKRIVLLGFSMGGNITLKYVGKNGKDIPDVISHAIAFSTPSDLPGCIAEINKPENKVYNKMFLRRLKEKIAAKAKQFPDELNIEGLEEISDWYTFDTRYSAPLNNLSSAEEFYYEASSRNFMSGTTVPSLIVNAQNDPMLGEGSSPKELAEKHPLLHLEVTKTGGHVGFAMPNKRYVWSELRAWDFCNGN